jgi:hypothetical protein
VSVYTVIARLEYDDEDTLIVVRGVTSWQEASELAEARLRENDDSGGEGEDRRAYFLNHVICTGDEPEIVYGAHDEVEAPPAVGGQGAPPAVDPWKCEHGYAEGCCRACNPDE